MVGLLKRAAASAEECEQDSNPEVSISNSDVFVTQHAVRMMLRREINSSDLIEAIYNPDEVSLGRGIEVFIHKAKIGIANLEVVCRPVPDNHNHYMIRVITIHKS